MERRQSKKSLSGLDRRKSTTSIKSVRLEHLDTEQAEKDAQTAARLAWQEQDRSPRYKIFPTIQSQSAMQHHSQSRLGFRHPSQGSLLQRQAQRVTPRTSLLEPFAGRYSGRSRRVQRHFGSSFETYEEEDAVPQAVDIHVQADAGVDDQDQKKLAHQESVRYVQRPTTGTPAKTRISANRVSRFREELDLSMTVPPLSVPSSKSPPRQVQLGSHDNAESGNESMAGAGPHRAKHASEENTCDMTPATPTPGQTRRAHKLYHSRSMVHSLHVQEESSSSSDFRDLPPMRMRASREHGQSNINKENLPSLRTPRSTGTLRYKGSEKPLEVLGIGPYDVTPSGPHSKSRGLSRRGMGKFVKKIRSTLGFPKTSKENASIPPQQVQARRSHVDTGHDGNDHEADPIRFRDEETMPMHHSFAVNGHPKGSTLSPLFSPAHPTQNRFTFHQKEEGSILSPILSPAQQVKASPSHISWVDQEQSRANDTGVVREVPLKRPVMQTAPSIQSLRSRRGNLEPVNGQNLQPINGRGEEKPQPQPGFSVYTFDRVPSSSNTFTSWSNSGSSTLRSTRSMGNMAASAPLASAGWRRPLAENTRPERSSLHYLQQRPFVQPARLAPSSAEQLAASRTIRFVRPEAGLPNIAEQPRRPQEVERSVSSVYVPSQDPFRDDHACSSVSTQQAVPPHDTAAVTDRQSPYFGSPASHTFRTKSPWHRRVHEQAVAEEAGVDLSLIRERYGLPETPGLVEKETEADNNDYSSSVYSEEPQTSMDATMSHDPPVTYQPTGGRGQLQTPVHGRGGTVPRTHQPSLPTGAFSPRPLSVAPLRRGGFGVPPPVPPRSALRPAPPAPFGTPPTPTPAAPRDAKRNGIIVGRRVASGKI